MKKKTTLVALLGCLALGFFVGSAYQNWQFKYQAFGHRIEYGQLEPEYAYAKLISDSNHAARDAVLHRIVVDNMESHEVISKALEAEFGSQDPNLIPPMAVLAMRRFYLDRYLKHPDPQQRLAAVFASRWWKSEGKVEVLRKFLDDSDKSVVDQTIYELGYIGDNGILPALQDKRFDNNAFVVEVRKALEAGIEFR
jgi:hypothetical protein